ncbi:MAG: pseudouridine synthase [Balneolales bacterium]|nr:pseudouridine synthase [Balneolales bacterium]
MKPKNSPKSDNDQPTRSSKRTDNRPAPTPASSSSVYRKGKAPFGPDSEGNSSRQKPVERRKSGSHRAAKSNAVDNFDEDSFIPRPKSYRKGSAAAPKTEPPGTYEESSTRDNESSPKSRRPVAKSKAQRNAPPRRIDKHSPKKETFESKTMSELDNSWRLNKFISNSGVCSRREADTLIGEGKVSVNGKVVTEMGVKVTSKDRVVVDGAEVNPVDFVYILLNKPDNYITTTDDEKGRNTVMDLVEDATGHHLYPVGRLDRHTTGLLLLTNDGDLANRLMHPKYEVRKIYEIQSALAITEPQLNSLRAGVELEDGMAKPYRVQRVMGTDRVIQMTIFEGRNRQVRRMMEVVGHQSIELSRITYGGLQIRGLRKGRWRFLKADEVNELRKLVKLFNIEKKKSDTTYMQGKKRYEKRK